MMDEKMDEKQYAWAFKADSIDYKREDSIEECLKQAKSENGGTYKKIYIGIVEEWGSCIDTNYLIQTIQETAWDENGEVAEDYLKGIPEHQLEELDNELNEVFSKWKQKYRWEPNFFTVKNVKKYDLENETFVEE